MVLVGSGGFWWVLVDSGRVLVGSGGVLVGFGWFWMVLVSFFGWVLVCSCWFCWVPGVGFRYGSGVGFW